MRLSPRRKGVKRPTVEAMNHRADASEFQRFAWSAASAIAKKARAKSALGMPITKSASCRTPNTFGTIPSPIDGRYAWYRLAVSLTVSTISGVGLWSVVVVLPSVEAEFGSSRSEASLPYMLTMVGFPLGSILMGRMTDKYGVTKPLWFGAIMIAAGYTLSAQADSLLSSLSSTAF